MRLVFLISLVFAYACESDDGCFAADDGGVDAGSDASLIDASLIDAQARDAGLADGGIADGGIADGGTDARATDAGVAGHWQPAPGTSWYWQLQGALNTTHDVTAYDLDLFDTPPATIAALHEAGRVVICYFSAGTYEEWRNDAGEFDADDLGAPLDEWPGERWVDVRSEGIRSIMRARMALAQSKGCDAVEPDNVDGYTNEPGIAFDAGDQLAYNRWLADTAHGLGLSIGLKNDLGQIPDLVAHFDWALNEECVAYEECDVYAPFISSNKAVFHVDYAPAGQRDRICAATDALGLSSVVGNIELDGTRWLPCW